MKLASRFVLPALVAMLGACNSASEEPTILTVPRTTATSAIGTTTTPPITAASVSPTTTLAVDPWTIEYPLVADTVDDLPAVLTDRIDAEQPDPDLTIDGPEDLDLWLREWLSWFSWVNANPDAGSEALERNVIPGSAFFESTQTALASHVDESQRVLGFAFKPVESSGTFDEFFDRQELLRLVVIAVDEIPSYVVDESGAVVTIREPQGGEATLRLLLRYREEEGEWVLENLEVLGE